ncbi:sigma-70 family RNA polymerase sigma factor [Streptomyces litchfieldiae]|uniref:Sigma-70 family RNA polymerase sigma factor n=1 Tax=Streptomyces litchfieldiae TaxID=3075543 RepID=A0ABU2MZR5_9ACTN|nr:sigma-70 family RNA polymerase sigma factor [Streptomyces sp. DSM 44938]MDT0347141.1 sigma-70 family RNA polymerase sigma factor [Streptomyces sp. DSM 44938]
MSDVPDMPPGADRAVRELTRRLPTAFWAFHEQYYRTYKGYAELMLGDPHAASRLVHRVMMDLAVNWNRLMQEESPGATAWAILKISVAQELDARDSEPALTEIAAFRRALLDPYREKFAALESGLGLYAAIARLPERQYDVIVLQYVLQLPPHRVASIMGVRLTTVRSHRRMARAKLARDLGLVINPDHDDEDESL